MEQVAQRCGWCLRLFVIREMLSHRMAWVKKDHSDDPVPTPAVCRIANHPWAVILYYVLLRDGLHCRTPRPALTSQHGCIPSVTTVIRGSAPATEATQEAGSICALVLSVFSWILNIIFFFSINTLFLVMGDQTWGL